MKFLIQWLINHFLFAGTMMFAAGAVAGPGAAAGGGENVGSATGGAATELAAGDGAGSVSDSDAQDDVGGEEGDGALSGRETQATDNKPPDEPNFDARTVPAEVRSHLAELRAAGKGPVADKIQGAFAKLNGFYKEFNGGLKEAREMKQIFADIGGKEGVSAVKEEISEFRDVDKQWSEGDARAIERFAAANPEALIKNAPNFLNALYKADNGAYSYLMAGVIQSDMAANKVQQELYLAKQMAAIGKHEEAIKHLENVEKWAGNIEQIAAKPPQAKPKPNTDQDARTQDLDRREAQIFSKSVETDVNPHVDSLMMKELKPLLKGQEIPERQQGAFKREVMAETRRLADADANFKKNFATHFAAKDQAGLQRLVKAKYAEVMPRAVKTVHGEWFRTTSFAGQKKQNAAAGKQNVAAAGSQRPAVEGWNKVAARPNVAEFDRDRTSKNYTTDEMIAKKSGILKNGKKIFWGNHPPV